MKILLLYTLILFKLISLSTAESYSNPWSVSMELNVKKGENLSNVIHNAFISIASGKDLISAAESNYFSKSTVKYHSNVGLKNSILIVSDEKYTGSIGELIYNICNDYGCGIIFKENENSFDISIANIRPDLTFSIFTPVPEALADSVSDIKLLNTMISKKFNIDCKLETSNTTILKDYVLASGPYKSCELLKIACKMK